MSTILQQQQQHQHQHFPHPSSLSSPSNPSSPTFPHSTSLSLNGAGYTLALRPGTAFDKPPPNYLSFVKTWDSNQVSRWLEDSNCGQYCETFKNNDITGMVLLDVDQSALKEMGVRSVGDRVRLVVAIKALRQKCVASALVERASSSGANGRPSTSPSSSSSASPPIPQQSSPAISSQHPSLLARPGSSASIASTTSSRHSGRIPPPLHLTQSNAHPLSGAATEAYQPLPTPTPRSTQPPSTSSLPPPPPPSSALRSSSIPAPTPSSSTGTTHRPSLPLSTTNSTSSIRPPIGAPPTRPSTGLSPSQPASSLRKTTTTGITISGSSSRPATANAGAGVGSSGYNHPYAITSTSNGNGNTSPTRTTDLNLSNYSITRSTTPLPPSSTSTTPRLLPSPHILPTLSSSPPIEATPTPSSTGYSVGRGPFARPTTPGGLVSASGPIPNSGHNHSQSQSQSLDAVLRKAVKFMDGDGGSKMVVVNDCLDGKEVLGRVLRKFGKEGEQEGGWGVWAGESGAGGTGGLRLLTEAELHQICQDTSSPERQRGLTLRKLYPASPITPTTKRGRKLQWMFGEPSAGDSSSTRPGGISSSSSPPRSPGGLEVPGMAVEPASPDGGEEGVYERQQRTLPVDGPTRERSKMNRASTISVMSALGGSEYEESPTNSPNINRSPPPPNSNSRGSFLSPQKRRFRNFFGQRPPSEMIATHLTDYFPIQRSENKKLLSKTVRDSMRRSGVRRDSQYSVISSAGSGSGGGTSWEKTTVGEGLSRFSGSSIGSGGIGGPVPPDKDYPPMITSRASLESSGGNSSNGGGYLEPPEEVGGGEERRMSVASSRFSGVSGWGGRGSDSASMVTVEEVTAVLEERRASMYLSGNGEDEGLEDDDGLSERDESESEEESEEEEERELEKKPVESSKPQLKWIKGALIGSGSFGSVYLGMNPMSGSLMAVKQVELPTGNSHNEERKKSMLDALEREIELLKVLQHENIVQYLDSSSDATHLNIFLEYVPGGSVAALLSNYGAFEEALVSKFVRQILTGLEYLHEREIIHRDIKGANILVDNKGGIKISDFGISKKVEDNLLSGAKVHRPSLQGSVYWMAPEVVKQEAYTSKADVWSLGCLVVEMLTGAHPWANLTQMQAIFRIGSQIRPSIPDDITPEAEDFLEKTFMIEYAERPSAKDLLAHPFIRDPEAFRAEQQTPTRATFSQNNSPVKEGA